MMSTADVAATWAGCAWALLLAACPATLPDDGEIRFSCRRDRDCPAPQRCRNLVCIDPPGSDRDLPHPIDAAADANTGGDRFIRDAAPIDRELHDRTGADLLATRDAQPGQDAAPSDHSGTTDADLPDQTTPDTASTRDVEPLADASLPDSGPAVLFAADLDSDPGTISWSNGTWVVSAGAAHQTNACYNNADAMVTAGDWTDMVVSADIRFDELCGLQEGGLLIRAQGATGCTGNHYYYCVVDLRYSQIYIGTLDGVCNGPSFASAILPSLTVGTWYRMTFTAIGNYFTCAVSGGDLGQSYHAAGRDSANRFTHGSAGFNMDGAALSYDNFAVSAP